MINLAYNYAAVDLVTGECYGCKTYSYEIVHDSYISVPHISNDYIGKYYNRATDLWYEDASMTIEADDINTMYHG